MNALLLCAALSLPAAAQTYSSAAVLSGVDVLLENDAALLRGKKAALITHPAAVTKDLEATADALFRTPGVTLVALMGPEHGIRGAAYAGESVSDQRDPKTHLPVYYHVGSIRAVFARVNSFSPAVSSPCS